MEIKTIKKIAGYGIIILFILVCGYAWNGFLGIGMIASMVFGCILLWFAIKWIFAE